MPESMMSRRITLLSRILSHETDTQISKTYGFSRQTCRNMRRALESDPLSIFILKNPLGAPTKLTADMITRIEQLTLSSRRSNNQFIANIISEEFSSRVSDETVRKARKKLGFKFEFPIHTFDLTPRQKQNRFAFAQRELAATRAATRDWAKVVFTDESYFCLGEDWRRLWRKPGEKGPDVSVRTKKFPQKLLVFGGIAAGFKSKLVILRKGQTVNGEVYIEKLIPESEIIPGMNAIHGSNGWTLMQDGASAHTKQTSIEFLMSQCNILEDWPSSSPDLNPIENLWAIMKGRAAELGATTLDELENIITDIWHSATDQEIWNLVWSMEKRLDACVKEGGGPNGY